MKTTTSKSYTDSTAEAGKTYYYKVMALHENTDANSAYSAIKSRMCDLAQPSLTLSNVASSGKIKVAWEKVDGAVSYKVYRAASKSGTYTLVKTTTSKSYTDSTAEAGKTYYYKVRALHENTDANSAYSAIKSRTCDLPQPEVSIALSSGKPKVTWKKIDGAVSYEIYRATSKDGNYTLMKTSTGSSYTNTSAVAGKTYYYKVVAVCSNTAGNSAKSASVEIKSK